MDVFNVTTAVGSLANVEEKVAKSSKEHLKEVIDQVDTKGVEIKLATYNGDMIDGLKSINKELGIDLIIIAPKSNDIQEELYLGNTSGRIIKQTEIPTLIVASPNDPGIPQKASELLNERIIGSKLEWLSPAHHLATLEHPEAFNTMLSRFLAMRTKD
jgi:pimeloyl-ACP methyl ester carboxylesterase